MLFNNKTFYRFECFSQPGFTITSGRQRDRNGILDMTVTDTYSSSENWQLYWQQDRYLLRNFDYDSGFQLGLTENDLVRPRLYTRNGSLGQQWDVIEVGGGYKLSNGLLGNASWLALPDGMSTPTMQEEGSGLIWNITRNPSADSDPNVPNSLSMYSEVEGFEVAQIPSSVFPSATLSSSTSIIASTPSSTTTSTAASTAAATIPASSSNSLAPGAIAGIAIGGAVIIASVIFAICILARKRKVKRSPPYKFHEQQNSEVHEKYVYPAELGSIQCGDKVAELPGVQSA